MVLHLVPGHHLGFYAIATWVAFRGQHAPLQKGIFCSKIDFLHKSHRQKVEVELNAALMMGSELVGLKNSLEEWALL